MRVELEQERPIPGPPREQRVCVAALFCEVEVVVAGRDLWKEVAPPPADDLFRLRFGYQAIESLAGRHMREPSAAGSSSFPSSIARRLGKLRKSLASTRPNDEQPRASLGHPVVGRVEHLPRV